MRRIASQLKQPKLNNLTKDEFIKRIEKLEGKALKDMVGSTVHWDYFSGQLASKRDPRFTAYIDEVNWDSEKVSYADLVAGLINVGYKPKKATERVKTLAYWLNENIRRNKKEDAKEASRL